MNKEKEIVRIIKLANEATDSCKVCVDCKFRINGDCCNRKVGEYLVNAGIGDKKQAVKEFCEKLESKFAYADDNDLYPHYSDGYNYAINSIKQVMRELFTELYGVKKQ